MQLNELWVREDGDGGLELTNSYDPMAMRFVRDEVEEWIVHSGEESPLPDMVIVDIETGKGLITRLYAINAPWYRVNRYRVVRDEREIEAFNTQNADFIEALDALDKEKLS